MMNFYFSNHLRKLVLKKLKIVIIVLKQTIKIILNLGL